MRRSPRVQREMSNSNRPKGSPSLVVEWDIIDPLDGVVNRPFLESVLVAALEGRRVGQFLNVGLTITNDDGIKELNLRYRGIDAPTDVLSFPLQQYEAPEKPKVTFPQPPGEPLHLGDVVISYERAVEQARSYEHSLDRELAYLVVHGVLHLLGYDHEDPEEAKLMRQEEESVLKKLGLGRE